MKLGKKSVWILAAAVVLFAGAGAAVALLGPKPKAPTTGTGPAARIGTETVIGTSEDVSTSADPSASGPAGIASAGSDATTRTSAPEPETSVNMQSTGTRPASSGKQFAYVRKAWRDGDRSYLSVDFAELLIGDAAAKAASARGEKSPPPKGYFIVNDDTTQKTIEIEPQAVVRYVNGDSVNQLVESSTNAFVTHWTKGDVPSLQTFPYYLTVENGIVVQVDQINLP